MDISLTSCEARPLKNVSRLMVLHIFSDAVDNWRDFGPSFPDLAIVKCMRHGGSGTHQTLINTVFRGEATLATFTDEYPADQGAAGKDYVWHYKSSSDLTRDCVAYYAGGIGYVDADKIMYRSKIAPTVEPANWAGNLGITQLMYQGVAPSRLAVGMGKYNFWAQQRCFLNGDTCATGTEYDILSSVMDGAADPSKLTVARFGQRAFFWATQGEMRAEKVNEYAYPSRVSPMPVLPPVDPGYPF
jgi:ABC-type phosphate transport system substrate-binding protein